MCTYLWFSVFNVIIKDGIKCICTRLSIDFKFFYQTVVSDFVYTIHNINALYRWTLEIILIQHTCVFFYHRYIITWSSIYRKVLRYQGRNQKPIMERQTIQWNKRQKIVAKILHRKLKFFKKNSRQLGYDSTPNGKNSYTTPTTVKKKTKTKAAPKLNFQ